MEQWSSTRSLSESLREVKRSRRSRAGPEARPYDGRHRCPSRRWPLIPLHCLVNLGFPPTQSLSRWDPQNKVWRVRPSSTSGTPPKFNEWDLQFEVEVYNKLYVQSRRIIPSLYIPPPLSLKSGSLPNKFRIRSLFSLSETWYTIWTRGLSLQH